jgi:hypothetical protein
MFIGHFALGFGAKRYAPAVSLGALFLACQLADLLWPTFTLLGIERFELQPGATVLTPLNFVSYPYSHSLVALVLWAIALAVVYKLLVRSAARTALGVLAALVVSHWVLDVLTHRPDMPLTLAGSTRVGLSLWNMPLWAVTLEIALFVLGVWLYTRYTYARDRVGGIAFWALVIFLLLVYAANLLGPLPPSTTAVSWSAQAIWLLVAWGYWVDRHRSARLP